MLLLWSLQAHSKGRYCAGLSALFWTSKRIGVSTRRLKCLDCQRSFWSFQALYRIGTLESTATVSSPPTKVSVPALATMRVSTRQPSSGFTISSPCVRAANA